MNKNLLTLIGDPKLTNSGKKTMFRTRKEKGNDFFKSTRIESCSYVKLVGGKAVAVPFIPKKK